MNQEYFDRLNHERALRLGRVCRQLQAVGADACLVSTPVNTYYLHQRIFKGYTFVSAQGETVCFVRRPADLEAAALGLDVLHVHSIRKPEQLPDILRRMGLIPAQEGSRFTLMLEGEEMPRSEWERLEACFPARLINGSHALRVARSVKTPFEQEQLRLSARRHEAVYRRIPELYRPGMSESEFEIEIEHQMRLGGCLGLFRCYGNDMEAFMGSLLSGDNAAVASPYDFALGGAGHPSNPVGAFQSAENGPLSGSGSPDVGSAKALQPGQSILVDMCGNFTGYLDDMSRCYSLGRLPENAYRAHQTALEIQQFVADRLVEGQVCEALWEGAKAIAERNGLARRFMGSRQQASFVGHGTGLVINELPVLAPRQATVLEAGMVLAVEPKIIVDGVGAVGTENTFIVGSHASEKLATLTDEIQPID